MKEDGGGVVVFIILARWCTKKEKRSVQQQHISRH